MSVSKERGSAADKHTDPKRITRKVKRLFKCRQKGGQSQECQLMLDFLDWAGPVTEEMVELLWRFLVYLQQRKVCLIDNETVFCFPLKKMVKLSRLGKAGGKNGK